MACAQFNKGACTFLEGPLKRRNRNSTEPKAKRGRKKNPENSTELSPELASLDHEHMPSLSPNEMTPLLGNVQHGYLQYDYDSGNVLTGPGIGGGNAVATQNPLLGNGAGGGAGTQYNNTPGGYALHPLSLLAHPLSSVQTEDWQHEYMPSIRYPEMTNGWSTAGRAAPDLRLQQLTLSSLSTMSSALFWLDALPGYDTLLNMLNEYGDLDTKKHVQAQSYFQPQPQHQYVQQVLPLAQYELSVQIPGWGYGEYGAGLASGISEALTLQGTLALANFSHTELRELLA